MHEAVICKRYFKNSGSTQNYWCKKASSTPNFKDINRGLKYRETAALRFN